MTESSPHQGSQHQIIDTLVTQGRLAPDDADRIRQAPRFVVQTRELISYVGGLIVLVGVIRLIAAVLEDASKLAIAGVLYVAAVILGLVAWRFARRPGAWGRFGEVLEIAAVAALVVAVALSTYDAGLDAESSALIAGLVVTGWSLVRLRSTQFSGTILVTAGIMTTSIALSSVLDLEEEKGAIPIFVGGLVLIALGTLRLRLPFIVRGIGAVTVLFTTINWMAMHEGLDGLLPGLLIGVAVFALGASRMWIEVFIPAGILIVVSVAMFVFRNVDNDVLQGLIVVVVGLATLGITALAFRRMHERPHHV
ncbi:MAG: hypothetical protein ACO3SP_00875 [Ilumatobacteraceae bacterium]